jgi:hypothetical protein
MNLAGRSRVERSSNKKTESTLSIDPQQAHLGGGRTRKSVPSSPEEPDSELDLRGRVRSNLSGNSRLPTPQSQQDPKEYVDSNADLPDSIRKAMESEDESEAWMEAIRNEADYLNEYVWFPETSAPPKRPQRIKLSEAKDESEAWMEAIRNEADYLDRHVWMPETSAPPKRLQKLSPGAIVRYLQQTKHLKQNHTDDHLSNIRLHVYSDSDYTACSNTARSIVGYLIYKGPVLPKRNSKRQSILAQNSAEAEHLAANDCPSEKEKLTRLWMASITRDTHST